MFYFLLLYLDFPFSWSLWEAVESLSFPSQFSNFSPRSLPLCFNLQRTQTSYKSPTFSKEEGSQNNHFIRNRKPSLTQSSCQLTEFCSLQSLAWGLGGYKCIVLFFFNQQSPFSRTAYFGRSCPLAAAEISGRFLFFKKISISQMKFPIVFDSYHWYAGLFNIQCL